VTSYILMTTNVKGTRTRISTFALRAAERAVSADGSDPKYDWMSRGALLAIMASLCAITWGKWGDLLVDSFNEFYVPMAIAEGKRLYFDFWYQYGPLIPYWHGLLFRLFGPHLWILAAIGIAIIAAITWLVYSLARLFMPVPLAFVAAFAYLLQAFQMGEFNYVLPYSFPAAYGTLMFVVIAWFLVCDSFHAKPWTYLLVGLLAGLEALTKTEFGLAAFTLLGGSILLSALRDRSWAGLLNKITACAPGVLICTAVYGWYVKTAGLDFLFGDNIAILPSAYFTRSMGSRWAHEVGSVATPLEIVIWAVYGLSGLALVVAGIQFASTSRRRGTFILLAAIVLAALNRLFMYAQNLGGIHIPSILFTIAPAIYFNRGMVLSAALLLAWTLWTWWRRREIGPQEAALLLLLLSGILLAARTVFRIRTEGYPIFYDVLAFPAYLVVVRQFAGFLRVPDSRRLWTWTSAAFCCGLVSLTYMSYRNGFSQSFRIATERGAIYVDAPTGKVFSETLEFLKRATARSERFVAWPRECAFYYFTGVTAPGRWWSLTPGILPPGKKTARFLAELDAESVRYVVLSNTYTPEYGVAIFGVDYNQQLYDWLTRKFRVVRTFGDYQPIRPRSWAVQIWERRPNELRVALNPSPQAQP
jgi:hypothetical protein